MDELIGRLVADIGIDRAAAEKSVGIILDFLVKEGPRMMSAGLSMGQVQSLARAVLAYAREKAGEDAVGEIVGAIPGLAQFV
ncbi:MAG: hypothetical protein ABSE22_19190 [Xanthobacteraceae bacterium]